MQSPQLGSSTRVSGVQSASAGAVTRCIWVSAPSDVPNTRTLSSLKEATRRCSIAEFEAADERRLLGADVFFGWSSNGSRAAPDAQQISWTQVERKSRRTHSRWHRTRTTPTEWPATRWARTDCTSSNFCSVAFETQKVHPNRSQCGVRLLCGHNERAIWRVDSRRTARTACGSTEVRTPIDSTVHESNHLHTNKPTTVIYWLLWRYSDFRSVLLTNSIVLRLCTVQYRTSFRVL